MPVRSTALLTASALTLLSLAACTSPSGTTNPPDTGPSVAPSMRTSPDGGALSSAELQERLLSAADLGPGYTARRTASPTDSHKASVLDCEPLERLGDDPYGSFPAQAKAVLHGANGKVTEELYSARPAELSAGIREIMSAMTACPTYQLAMATSVVEVSTRTVPAPRRGEEQWAQLGTVRTGSRSSTVQQLVIRDGSVLLVLSGAPTQVALTADTALAKAKAR
ncbi:MULTISPECIES: hypothetical protein [Streptomyces]|uniref:PknH-like extracellular domain-containing protein n=2 Tax=Streptomyces TaxID=1883 RepID=A0A117IUU5_9ACTN|nr:MULTISPECIES: hypothetical protein [Streptomyces]KUH35498.1 hypothetical protein ATE80_28845 [Streptomyces kanasensis]UUS33984.1 hypothetical protein NRO40_26270 [Streptomyces changanensis]